MADKLPKLVWKQSSLKERFKFFKQRLELLFKVQVTRDDEKCFHLLRALNDNALEALEVFHSWGLGNEEAASYTTVIAKFETAIGQSVNFRVARLQLHYMYEDKTESLDAFVKRCRTLALKCECLVN